MRAFVLLAVLPLLVAAQPQTVPPGGRGGVGRQPVGPGVQTQQAQPTKPEDLGSLEGQVVNALTGEPIRRANILLMRMSASAPNTLPIVPTNYTTSSDAAGHFAMTGIEPGEYRMSANRNGFVGTMYGTRGPGRIGTPLSIARQQHVDKITLKMTPQGVITGRVIDEDGEPMANARITLQSYHYVQGRKQLSPSGGGGANTNDLGEYRAFGVAPGKYFLSVTPMPMVWADAVDRSAAPPPEEAYVETYYPGATDPAAAMQLEVAAGAQLHDINLTLSRTHTVHVKGHVTYSAAGRQTPEVYLAPRTSGAMVRMMRPTRGDSGGNFDIRDVTPGAYTLVAITNEGGTPHQARMPIEVGSTNLEGLNVVIGPGITVKGHIRGEGDPGSVDLSSVRLNLQPRDPGDVMFGRLPQGKPNEAGVFEMSDVVPDRYNLFVSGLPRGAYVKSIRTEQSDVLANGLDLTSGAAPGTLEVVISPRAASVAGTVLDPNTGNAAPGGTVVLVPQEKERRDQQSYFRMITSDQSGAFNLAGVPPGEYKAYAWEDVEYGAYMDPDFMKPIEDKGEAVSLEEGDQKAVTLKLIPADSAGGARQ